MQKNNSKKESSVVKMEIAGVLLLACSILLWADFLGYSVGGIGRFAVKVLQHGFGVGAPFVPLLLLVVGLRYMTAHSHVVFSLRFWAYIGVFISSLALYHQFKVPVGEEILPVQIKTFGGLVSGAWVMILRKIFAFDGTTIVIMATLISFILLATGYSISSSVNRVREWNERRRSQSQQNENKSTKTTVLIDTAITKNSFYNQDKESPPAKERKITIDLPKHDKNVPTFEDLGLVPPEKEPIHKTSTHKLPPISILKKIPAPKSTRTEKEIENHARTLESTLESFGIQTRVVHVTQGPAVTRYELEPAPGVKISRIVSLSDDIALKLAAQSVRIEAPIPGKSVIGIEVPNRDIAPVSLREVMEGKDIQEATSPLTVALGKDISGQTMLADLAKMPHLLVAGATGSGKSICINILITSILLRSSPDVVKFLLIDPKVVELSNYNGIPHLVAPVVTEPKRAASALRWAVQDMERRYSLFAAAGVRDIGRYNEVNPEEKLPYIVIIIDELADLMMVAPVDVEDAICRLAQMARASGIHLVIATQRPSVDVITGTIKANIPSRISFAVTSQIDSRTILDMAGAEKLLGRGDMLYFPTGTSKPTRIQGAFVSENEVEAIVKFLSQQTDTVEPESVPTFDAGHTAASTGKFDDELLEESVKLVLDTGQASASLLQRKFRIGYSRAARLVDMMEEMQIVSTSNGSKPREVIMNSEQVFSRYFTKS